MCHGLKTNDTYVSGCCIKDNLVYGFADTID